MMSRLGFKTVVYNGELCLGELEAVPAVSKEKSCSYQFPNNEIVIHHFSPPSDRCAPLAVLQTVSSFSVRCKLESSVPIEQPHLINLHSACFYESKTAVILIGDEEIHMVAMPSRQKKFPCFWCWSAPKGLYAASLSMLNPRCLAIVFDLDETLIVANTMKSFEDRIEALRAWIVRENDPLRYSGMAAELKRYMDDRALLKMYCENDSVADIGNVFKAQMEEIPPISDSQNKLVRPVIRLPEKNIVLTRINPEIRDTSVLVRLRPAWEDLRNYLNAKGRKRFEVYVCTMAERDYALEIWRLLDPEAHLIDLKQLPDRVFCVKAGSKKSLSNVFQSGMCHPKMGMVIDDRMKVWEDRDQPRVHVVPPFAPYYAPQAETAHPVPVLCVARNVACNVRGWFFREFDESFSRKVVEISYEDDVGNLPHAPDVSNFMVSEDAGFVPNGNSHVPIAEGMSGAEVERRINQSDDKKIVDSAPQSINFDANPRAVVSQPGGPFLPNPVGQMSSGSLLPSQKPGILGASFRREACSENDYDMKKRVQTVKFSTDARGQTSSEPLLLPRVPAPVSASSAAQSQGGWLKEEGFNKGNKNDFGFNQDHGPFRHDKHRANQNSYSHSASCFTSPGLFSATPQTKAEEACIGQQVQKPAASLLGVGVPHNHASSNSRDIQNGAGRTGPYPSSSYISVLQEIGKICSAKIEFRPVMSTSHNVQFTVEVFYTGQKIGIGMGKTRKDAQQQAAENALRCLAEGYRRYMMPGAGGEDRDPDKHSLRSENGFLWDDVHSGKNEVLGEDGLAKESTPQVGFSGSV